MNELIDEGMIYLIEGMYAKVSEMFGLFISDAQALAAVFMLLYFGVESYKMMSGDKQLEIMPLLRPFGISLVIIFWVQFVEVIRYPSTVLTNTSKGHFEEQLKVVEELSRERYALIDSVSIALNERALEVRRAEEEARDKSWSLFGIDLEEIEYKIMSMYLYVAGWIKQFIFNMIEYVVVTIWQVCVFLVFLLQLVFMGLLVTLGPLAFALSILPAFKDNYIQWISRFISVSLYGALAYLALSICLKLMIYGLNQELEILKSALSDEKVFVLYTALASGGTNLFIITCLLGAITMLTIPTLSTWIVSTSGVGHAVGGMARGASGGIKSVTGKVL